MKRLWLVILFLVQAPLLFAQGDRADKMRERAVHDLIDRYALARERRDTALLKNMLTDDVDQLVSSGEWRAGIGEAVKGMLESSGSNPGTRRLVVERVRFLDMNNGIADARYEISNADGTQRKMWSTFVVVNDKGSWKIAAIRNMLPASPR